MSDDKNLQGNQDPSDENLEDFKPKTEDEMRQSVIDEFDLDADVDDETIAKLTKKELKHQNTLSTAIKQKIKYRDELKEKGGDEENKEDKGGEGKKKPDKTEVEEMRAELEEVKLGQLGDLTDDVKSEIKKYATINNVSLKEAKESNYINFIIDKEKTEKEAEDASLGGSHNSTGGIKKDFSDLKEGDIANMSEEEFTNFKEHQRNSGK